MSILAALLKGPAMSIVGDVAGKFFDNKDKKEAFQNAVELELLKNQKAVDTAGADIIKAEINAGGLAAQWRPILALCFGGIVVFYTIMQALFAFGWVEVSVDVPSQLWNLLMVMIGGYTVGRSGEKIAEQFKK